MKTVLVSHFQYKLAAVYILSAATVQTSVWICVIKRGLVRTDCLMCTVLRGALCYTALLGAVQSVSH